MNYVVGWWTDSKGKVVATIESNVFGWFETPQSAMDAVIKFFNGKPVTFKLIRK